MTVQLPDFPDAYTLLLHALRERICRAQISAALAVNRELVLLCWQIGREILAQQAEHGWGAKVIDRLAQDLRQVAPNLPAR
jgi:hypothetical protein